MDPFTLTAIGLATAGSLAGGIHSAVTAKDRQREYEKKARQQALIELQRSRAASLGMPTYSLDAAMQNKQIDEQGAQLGKIDPMSFVPFVQNGAQLASGIYQAANSPEPQNARMAPDPIARQQQAAQSAADAAERAEAMKYFQSQGWKPYGGVY